MFYLTSRQVKTAAAATAGAAIYLGLSEIGARKLRLSGLWVLSAVALAGMATAKSSAKAYAVEKRVAALVPDIHDAKTAASSAQTTANSAQTTATSAQSTANTAHTTADAAQTTANAALPKAGGTISGGLTVSGTLSTNTIASAPTFSTGLSMGGNLIMNGHDAYTFGHITANQIGPGGQRANLPSGATLADVIDRCNWLNGQLANANINY